VSDDDVAEGVRIVGSLFDAVDTVRWCSLEGRVGRGEVDKARGTIEGDDLDCPDLNR